MEARADGVTALRIDRSPHNALSRALLDELGGAARALASDAGVKAVVITGSGRSFSAGADISELGDRDAAREIGERFRAAFDAIAAIPRPVIAAINGVALGGGSSSRWRAICASLAMRRASASPRSSSVSSRAPAPRNVCRASSTESCR
jgi:enoyl-CoA hydratase/carnithine racemase